MGRMIWLLPLCLLAACAHAPGFNPRGMDTVGDTPKASDICLKPEDSSGITILLHRYAAHGVFQVKPEWTVAFRSTTIPATILFPRPVDRATVKIAVEPSSWTLERTDDAANDSQFTFRLLPGGKLTTEEAQPGWIVIRMQEAFDKQGRTLLSKPWSLRIFVYDQQTAASHPYLPECQSTLTVRAEGE
jgi:hypothetical protein